ncbi:subtilase family domain-containing protein [Rhizoctonia solani AG-1 IA]|uniref:Subtilase family domain-containing protein n=1 Tax=Thanatephorus cucumeris (strain AG1-IA) TaxID=983506 RepID=L8WDQ1_THACA|nr:subtilase family domain-containing protein [Rhizoctonia solani AG-1 IA]
MHTGTRETLELALADKDDQVDWIIVRNPEKYFSGVSPSVVVEHVRSVRSEQADPLKFEYSRTFLEFGVEALVAGVEITPGRESKDCWAVPSWEIIDTAAPHAINNHNSPHNIDSIFMKNPPAMPLEDGYYKILNNQWRMFLEYNQYTHRLSTVKVEECGDIVTLGNNEWSLKTRNKFMGPLVIPGRNVSCVSGNDQTYGWMIKSPKPDRYQYASPAFVQYNELVWFVHPSEFSFPGLVTLARGVLEGLSSFELVPMSAWNQDSPGIPRPLHLSERRSVKDSYLVLLKKQCNLDHHITWVRALGTKYSDNDTICRIGYQLDISATSRWDGDLNDAPSENTTWGLERISKIEPLDEAADVTALTYTYCCPSPPAINPTDVDVYVLDSGVLTTHQEFQGRAHNALNLTNEAAGDHYGHGTHAAGIIAGQSFGVAKEARVISVKVGHHDRILATLAATVAGIQWVCQQARASGRASIISMGISFPASKPLDQAVLNVVADGLHFVASAGNQSSNAGRYSPGRALGAITVGASTIGDSLAGFSNYGPSVTIYAPGESIVSAGVLEPGARGCMSGTSVAAPYVAGALAQIIRCEGNMTPAEMRARLLRAARSNALNPVRRDTFDQHSKRESTGCC